MFGKKIKNAQAPWKREQIKRILYNRQYIGEWKRTINGEKKIFPCPVIIDPEIFQKAQESQALKSANTRKLGMRTLNPFSGRIFDQESGIPMKLYPHQRLKIKVFRLSYPKPAEISYKRGNIPYDEVCQEVYKILLKENQIAKRIADMIGKSEWENEKMTRIQKVKEAAKEVFQKMLSIEGRNMPLYNQMLAGEISKNEYEIQKEINVQEFMELDEKLEVYLKEIKKIETCFSMRNPWIKMFSEMVVPQELTRLDVKRCMDRVESFRYERIEVKFKNREWREMLPERWMEEVGNGTKE